MENTSSAAVKEKEAESVAQPTASAENTTTSMADHLAAVAPEKRRFFRKACNHTARTVLFDLLIMSLVTGIGFTIMLVVKMLGNPDITQTIASGDTQAAEGFMSGLMSDPSFYLWFFASTAVSAVCAHLWSSYLHCKTRGYKLWEGFQEGRMTPGLFFGGLVCALGSMWAWAYIYMGLDHFFDIDSGSALNQLTDDSIVSVKNLPTMIVYCTYVCIIAPIFEELLFRGVILKTLSKYNVLFAAFVSALFFGLLHGNLAQTPGAFVCGFALAYVAARSGSLRGPIIIHMIVNTFSTAISALSVNLPEKAGLIDIITYAATAAFIVGAILIVCIRGKKFKWEALDPATNHILLPKINTRVKYRLLHLITCIWVLVFLYISVENILAAMGQTLLAEHLIEYITTLIQK